MSALVPVEVAEPAGRPLTAPNDHVGKVQHAGLHAL
jgi:hypothetical protein